MVVRTKAAAALLRDKRMSQMEDKLRQINNLKAEIAQMSAELDALEWEVVPVLKLYETKGYTLDGDVYTGVAPTRTYWDEKGLRDDLGEEIWKQIEKITFDREKLGGLVSAGVVAAKRIAVHATIKPTKPYVLVTRKADSKAGHAKAA